MPTPTDPWSIILTSVVLSACVTALIQFINSSFERSASDKRHLREQAIKLALEQWQHEAKEERVHMAGGVSGGKVFEYHGPPARDLYEVVFRALRFVDAFSKKEVTESNLKDFLSKPKPE